MTEQRAELERALAALPAEQREVLVLKEVHRLGYDQIGRMLDVSREVVTYRLAAARREMLRRLCDNELVNTSPTAEVIR
jgi:RNA polymerase sigma-70 factor (ECF subfamily)